MIVFGIIMIAIGLIVTLFAIIIEIKDLDICITALGWFAGSLFTLGLSVLMFCTNNEPTAMDVYQGKTTLQYTIVDSVKVDSVVVWKIKED